MVNHDLLLGDDLYICGIVIPTLRTMYCLFKGYFILWLLIRIIDAIAISIDNGSYMINIVLMQLLLLLIHINIMVKSS